ncbi:MAG: hypothetical protein ACK41C_05830 [Phenylobacterium sp.]|uniref:hypothetical protein n=1 Tax=Phenylobacterium sp. TaxID=1871053 RepID=UPI0039195145
MFLRTLPQQVWFVALVVVCILAFWRGGRPERLVAVLWAISWLISRSVYNYDNWIDPQWSVLAVDVGVLIAFAALAAYSDRTWLLFATAFQLLNVVTHVAMIVDSEVRARAYVYGLVIWSYMVLAAIGVGAWAEGRRESPNR